MSWFFDKLLLELSSTFLPEHVFEWLCDFVVFAYTYPIHLYNTDFFFYKAVHQLFSLATLIGWSALALVTVILCKISASSSVTTSKTNGVSSSSTSKE